MSRVKINEDNIFTYLAFGNWLLLALLVFAGLIFGSLKLAASVLAGGILSIANFYWMLSILKRVLILPVEKAGSFTLTRYLLRLAVLAFLIWLLITYVGINIFGLLVGLSIIVINVVFLSLYKLTLKGD